MSRGPWEPILLVAMVVVVGCGGDGASSPAPASVPDAGAEVQDARETEVALPPVSGTWIRTYVNSRGRTESPNDLSARAVGVWTVAADGTFLHHGGRGAADGSFQVANVPPGPFTFYIETDSGRPLFIDSAGERNIDLGALTSGRPNIVISNDAATSLTLSLSGLAPWAAGDSLQVGLETVVHFLGVGPAAGATSYTLPLSRPLPLLDGPGAGDSLVVAQVVAQALAPGVVRRSIATGRIIDSFTLRAYEANALEVSTHAPPEQAVSIDFRQSAFAARAAEVFPGSRVGRGLVSLDQVLDPAMPGPPWTTFSLRCEDGSADVAITTSYRPLLPETLSTVASASVSFQVAYPIAGSAAPAVLSESIVVRDVASALLGGPILPEVSPPRAPTINGSPARETLGDVGETPLVAWQAPSLGQPSLYQILVRELVADLDAVRAVLVATLYTEQLQLRIPRGILQSGKHYVLSIGARQRQGSRAVQPFAGGPRISIAATLTGRISP